MGVYLKKEVCPGELLMCVASLSYKVRLTAAVILIIAIFLPSELSAQRVEWVKPFEKNSAGQLYSIEQAHDSGFIAAGSISLPGSPGTLAFVVCTDDTGDTLWTRRFAFNNTSLTCGRDIIATSDGGYLLTGYCSERKYDIFILKLNLDGDSLWSRSYGCDAACYAYAVCETRDGGYAVTGHTYCNRDTADLFILKVDPDGDSLWMSV